MMDRMLSSIDAAILEEYMEIKSQGKILAGIENMYRQLRFGNPELAGHIRNKMMQIARENGDLSCLDSIDGGDQRLMTKERDVDEKKND